MILLSTLMLALALLVQFFMRLEFRYNSYGYSQQNL